ncbi:MAG: hypothetical protein LUC43_09655 [Burkholderiales bacterium]|nr:hypothetical protein [Burkholderiales bacterium]
MEPKLNNLNERPEFPPEPQFHEADEKKVEVPKIVPAELHNAPPARELVEEVQINPKEDKERDIVPPTSSEEMLSQLSKDLDDLSRPLVKEEKAEEFEKPEGEVQALKESKEAPKTDKETPKEAEKVEKTEKLEEREESPQEVERPGEPVKYAEPEKIVPYNDGLSPPLPQNGMAFPTFDDLGDPEEPSSSHPFIKFIVLLLCLGAIIVASWQVCLFLQPGFIKNTGLSDLALQSCDFLYCPPLRTLKIADEQMDEVGQGKWIVSFRLVNQDMRPQRLPFIQLIVEGVSKSVFRKTYAPDEYTILPRGSTVEGGTASKVQIPFDFNEGQPTKFIVLVAESNSKANE